MRNKSLEAGTSGNPKKRRGRPPGSKNKTTKVKNENSKEISMRQLAELSADPDFLGQLCKICLFSFDDPIKQGKSLTTCGKCGAIVHEPCLDKSGCTC